MDCIFCKIVAGDIPSYKVYEDENCLAFLDIDPASIGHTLVIPKKHFSNLNDILDEKLSSLILSVKKVAKILQDKLGVKDYQILQNNGRGAGQEVFHIHFHVIPREINDGQPHFNHYKYKEGEMSELINKINF